MNTKKERVTTCDNPRCTLTDEQHATLNLLNAFVDRIEDSLADEDDPEPGKMPPPAAAELKPYAGLVGAFDADTLGTALWLGVREKLEPGERAALALLVATLYRDRHMPPMPVLRIGGIEELAKVLGTKFEQGAPDPKDVH